MYKIIEHDPILGSTEWTIRTCRSCNGKGRIWYPGCDDRDQACRSCDGMGETATSRPVTLATGSRHA